jgi:hypothetical protein
VDDLLDTLKECAARLDDYGSHHTPLGEENTKAALIEPVLKALGGNVFDPDELCVVRSRVKSIVYENDQYNKVESAVSDSTASCGCDGTRLCNVCTGVTTDNDMITLNMKTTRNNVWDKVEP